MKLWIARDNYKLLLSNEEPELSAAKTNWLISSGAEYIFLDEEMFPEVTFENSPQQVEIKLI